MTDSLTYDQCKEQWSIWRIQKAIHPGDTRIDVMVKAWEDIYKNKPRIVESLDVPDLKPMKIQADTIDSDDEN